MNRILSILFPTSPTTRRSFFIVMLVGLLAGACGTYVVASDLGPLATTVLLVFMLAYDPLVCWEELRHLHASGYPLRRVVTLLPVAMAVGPTCLAVVKLWPHPQMGIAIAILGLELIMLFMFWLWAGDLD